MNTIRRIISIVVVLLILVSTAGQRTYAAEADKENTAAEMIRQEAGSLIVEAESADYFKYDNGRLYVYGGTVTVKTRSDAEYSTERIEVSGYSAVVLSGVRIKAKDGAAIRILPGTDAEIRLGGAGQEKNDGDANDADQTEQTQEENKDNNKARGDGSQALLSSLRVTGGGKLTAVGGEGAAAIGGSRGQSACGIIGIESGNVKAIAGRGADGIGCAEGSAQDPVYAPTVSGQVSSLTALSDGKGRPIATAAVSSEENSASASKAALLSATFVEPGDGSLAGLAGVRIRDINSDFEVSFDMPEGYRSFAVKVKTDADLMIEQGGRSFADAGEETFSGEVEVSDEKDLLFRGSMDYSAGRIFLSPVMKEPVIDVEVTGQWEDEDNMKNLKARIRILISDLRQTLKQIGQEELIIRRSGQIAIRREAIDCDYYRLLDGDMDAVNEFHGDYMLQYSWAEMTAGQLAFKY